LLNPLTVHEIRLSENLAIPYVQSIASMNGFVYQNYPMTSLDFTQLGENPLRLVLLGKGFISLDRNVDDRILKFPDQLRLVQSLSDDFAIVKFGKVPSGYRCAQNAKSKPSSGELIWSAGYPKYVDRKSESPSEIAFEAYERLNQEAAEIFNCN
jgi:hypothetical protein